MCVIHASAKLKVLNCALVIDLDAAGDKCSHLDWVCKNLV